MHIDDATSIHVVRASAGGLDSLSWLVERFSPLLLAQARYRLGDALRTLYDPEDLVHDTWTIALAKLPTLQLPAGGHARGLLAFLSTTLFLRVRGLVRKHVIRQHLGAEARDQLPVVPAEQSGVVTRCVRREAAAALRAAIESLPSAEQELLVLRGIEQCPYDEIAAVVGGEPKSLAVRYGRLLRRLRDALPGSVLEDLADSEPA